MTDVLTKIRKLLALAQSANVNEAANAAAAAQKLMAEHRIEQAMLETPASQAVNASEPVGREVFAEAKGRKLPRWSSWLAGCVAKANGCQIYLTGATIHVVGRPGDAATARYLYTYLAAETDRLCERACAQRVRSVYDAASGRTWANNFRLGAVEAINTRLKATVVEARVEAKKLAVSSDTLGNGHALARVNVALAKLDATRDEVARYVETRLNLRKGASWTARHDSGAREAGRVAGAAINLGSGKPLASGSRAALRG